MGYDVDCCGISHFYRKVGKMLAGITFLVGYIAGWAMAIMAVVSNDR